ncbi:unnamed protein product [Haemonchus placei]|uniref:Protein LTV1 homolog n=1 Tax=Haemonchus placei TaxID=6290 RepID=A0A0N4W079_HAEPC|nr:unnamed protein product [Haemonchus placei]
MMKLDSYERFLDIEDNLTKPSEFRAPSHVKITGQLSVEVQEVSYGDGEEFIEPSEKKKRKVSKKVLSEVQLQKQAEKRRKAIEREISASIKSKCEQYMFCHVSRRTFDEFRRFSRKDSSCQYYLWLFYPNWSQHVVFA